MNIQKWLNLSTESLDGKTVAISGSTGGLGKEICKHLASLGADLILMDRNSTKSNEFITELKYTFSNLKARHIRLDLEDFSSVKETAFTLKNTEFDVLIHNAGAYKIEKKICSTGYGNIFQINFLSPYYITKELYDKIIKNSIKVVVVGSIAHNYSKTDTDNVDFHNKTACSLIYGNAKRYLMFSLFKLFENTNLLSIVHPGITFTNITNHYPKLIFAIIKHPMKIIFNKPKTASLNIIKGIFDYTNTNEWIGPRLFNIWGSPNKKKLNTCTDEEITTISNTAEAIYHKIKDLDK